MRVCAQTVIGSGLAMSSMASAQIRVSTSIMLLSRRGRDQHSQHRLCCVHVVTICKPLENGIEESAGCLRIFGSISGTFSCHRFGTS